MLCPTAGGAVQTVSSRSISLLPRALSVPSSRNRRKRSESRTRKRSKAGFTTSNPANTGARSSRNLRIRSRVPPSNRRASGAGDSSRPCKGSVGPNPSGGCRTTMIVTCPGWGLGLLRVRCGRHLVIQTSGNSCKTRRSISQGVTARPLWRRRSDTRARKPSSSSAGRGGARRPTSRGGGSPAMGCSNTQLRALSPSAVCAPLVAATHTPFVRIPATRGRSL